MSGRWSLSTTTARGREANQMPFAIVGIGGSESWSTPGVGRPYGTPGGGWEPWGIPGERRSDVRLRGVLENNGASSGLAMVYDVTMADENILQCGVCFLPLRPPIFQCTMGHVLCSSCANKLKDVHKCHMCRVAMPGGYQRCHAMEDVVNSIHVPCPHAPYGCDTRPTYHARDEHLLQCPQAPCHCPGNTCSFVGPVATLIEHLRAAHGWSCTNEASAGAPIRVYLQNGFNFVTVVRGSAQYLFLLNMVNTPFGHAISVVWIRSPATIAISSAAPATRNTTCHLELFYFAKFEHVSLEREHCQRSCFQVEGRCPSNGLPNPFTSFQFFVPKYGGGTESDEGPICVVAEISICSS